MATGGRSGAGGKGWRSPEERGSTHIRHQEHMQRHRRVDPAPRSHKRNNGSVSRFSRCLSHGRRLAGTHQARCPPKRSWPSSSPPARWSAATTPGLVGATSNPQQSRRHPLDPAGGRSELDGGRGGGSSSPSSHTGRNHGSAGSGANANSLISLGRKCRFEPIRATSVRGLPRVREAGSDGPGKM